MRVVLELENGGLAILAVMQNPEAPD